MTTLLAITNINGILLSVHFSFIHRNVYLHNQLGFSGHGACLRHRCLQKQWTKAKEQRRHRTSQAPLLITAVLSDYLSVGSRTRMHAEVAICDEGNFVVVRSDWLVLGVTFNLCKTVPLAFF